MRSLPCFGSEFSLVLNTMHAISHPQRSSLDQLNHDRPRGHIVLLSHEPSVGNKLIDSEHKKLRNIINGIASIIAAGKLTALSEKFELLEHSLCAYFVIEETIAQALNFDFKQHKLAHQYLLNSFKRIKDELMAKNGMWSKFEEEGYIYSLIVYLDRHIKVDSNSFKVVLDTQPYNIKLSEW